MKELASRFEFRDVEQKWLKYWEEKGSFKASPNSDKKPFTVMIPPPNVTGILHMGHALNDTLQDILIRYERMAGREALWMPGTDHAGIATQNVVEKQLAKEGQTRHDVGREGLLERLWAWKAHHGDTIIHQLKKLGASCDWDRTRFTMDEGYSNAVKEVFIRLYDKGLIYQGQYIINWCPRCQTALSDEEAEHQDKQGKLYHIRYPLKDNPDQFVTVATTRPETMLGDTAVAVNPTDERYQGLIGKTLVLPLIHREITIIADDFVSKEFGTGAVKVTPAHDPNDFAMGQRHKLESINIMQPDAVLNENAGPFNGLDRFEGRKAVVNALKEAGMLVKIEDHNHAVGHCYRCHTIVEPYLSKQWFVKMKPLAKPALEVVQNGRVKISPARWEKVYINWLEDIRDWCISRQIWWGHRIPVWYDDQGGIFVARSEEEAKVQASARHGRDVNLTQDPDVLDTWFSSWLWPFATLGWPEKTESLKYFYPGNALFTAPEIIFFWVARMVMAGIEFMGDVPFTDVYIHGTVRDTQGRKMSKSLGNAIDPLEIIEEYGADALRFSLIINSGQDIFISKEKFEIGRNFANKIWNASRLILMNTGDVASITDPADLDPKTMDLPSQWIVSRYHRTLEGVTQAIETFRYSEAESLIYEFFWNNLCDWYLEMIKGRFAEPSISRVVMAVLDGSLRMMHPFIPFVTEEIFSIIHPGESSLTTTAWPTLNGTLINPDVEQQMQTLIDLTSSLRNVRSQWNIKPGEAIQCTFVPEDETRMRILEANLDQIARLARIESPVIDRSVEQMKDAAAGVIEGIKFFIPLGGVIDITKEKARILGQIEQFKKSCQSISGRLANEGFTQKAPKEVIEKDREALASYQTQVAELEKVIANLS